MGFYDTFVSLCAQSGKAPSAVAVELGIAKSSVSGWKSGRNGANNATLKKIADYFGVSVDYLRGLESLQDVTISGTADPQAAVRQGLIPAGTGIFAPKTEQELLDEKALELLHQHSLDAQSAIIDLLARMAVKPEEK